MFLTKKDHGEELFVLPIDYKFVLILFSTFLIMYGKRMEREREKSYSNITKGEMQFKKRGGKGGGGRRKHWRNLLDLYSFWNEILVNDLLNFCQLKSIYNVNFYFIRERVKISIDEDFIETVLETYKLFIIRRKS